MDDGSRGAGALSSKYESLVLISLLLLLISESEVVREDSERRRKRGPSAEIDDSEFKVEVLGVDGLINAGTSTGGGGGDDRR